MKLFFKGFGFVFAALFIWAAIMQYNDPDPYVWYAIYGIAAIVSVAFALNKLSFNLTVLLAFAYLLDGIVTWPAKFEGLEIGQGDIKNIEEGREALGLLFCAGIFCIYALRLRYVKGVERG
ncbi:transmembrane 220 family protein [Arenibacter sp. GZD96]|uniref:transmembrane 220 family protein n=1 Tax=Aurantibrevibacter litoralis TaxID=3106030 RepID=UPI002AFF1439|nr:transmembrane 220 family protein [Arenibacter sp. GZD-96]MEA1785999.1 transmembrane 220 family protein [Arenibacter sp. GZD-96]